MKAFTLFIAAMLTLTSWASAQSAADFTNFIRQKQYPTAVRWDMPVSAEGEALSPLPINPGGAQFELWTVNTLSAKDYLLEARYVGAYVPVAGVSIRSEDAYAVIPRTRADRPFFVNVTINGLLSGADDPEASKKVTFLQHVQSYGATGTGFGIDRTQATLKSQSSIEANGTSTLTYAITAVPGGNRAKVRGEERFSVFSLEDYQAPVSQLSSQFIQIWPVADGTLTGITSGQMIRFKMPVVTIAINDLYPDSHTYAQVYKGPAQLGTTGKIVPGSSLLINDTVPQSRILTLSNYNSVFGEDGQWTMELLTKTPFGLDRLAHVTFNLDLTLQMNGSVTTID